MILKKGHEIKGNYKAQSSFLFLCNRKQIEGKTYMDFCDRKNYFHQEQSESIDDNDTFTEEYSNRGSVRDMSWYGRELRGVRQISQIGPTYPGVCGGE